MAERKELHMLPVGAPVWRNKFFKLMENQWGVFLSPPAPAGFSLVKKRADTEKFNVWASLWGGNTGAGFAPLELGFCCALIPIFWSEFGCGELPGSGAFVQLEGCSTMEALPNLQDSAVHFHGVQHHKPQSSLKPCLFVHSSSRNPPK